MPTENGGGEDEGDRVNAGMGVDIGIDVGVNAGVGGCSGTQRRRSFCSSPTTETAVPRHRVDAGVMRENCVGKRKNFRNAIS